MQKFFRGQTVKISDTLRAGMSHFESGCLAIVDHSSSDRRGLGTGINGEPMEEKYGLLVKNEHNGYGWSYSAWYYESDLVLVGTDRDAGEAMLQEYKMR